MREITRSVKVALKCLVAVVLVDVDLRYWTSKVEHLVTFAAIVSNVCTVHARKRLFMHFRCKFRHRRSIPRPRFPSAKFRRFGDVLRWFLHFIFWMSAIFLLPVCLTYWPRKYTTRVDPTLLIPTKFEVDMTIHCRVTASADTPRDLVTLTFDLLTLNSSHWLPWKMRTRPLHCACAESHDQWVRGQK